MNRSRLYRTITVATLLASLFVGAAAGAATAAPNIGNATSSHLASASGDSLLSPTGDRAIADLRECVTSESHLDVYYLIDASGSLFAEPGQTGTDPGNVRSDLIANSLSQLAGLRPDLDVSYALGFFGTKYRLAIPWSAVAPDGVQAQSAKLKNAILDQSSMGWTNWQSAVAGAQQELAAQHKATGGCQLLVWLTDGGINLNNNNAALDDAALSDMCGAPVLSGSDSSHGHGVFNELRQAGVVVVGVLLKVPGGSGDARDSIYMPYMRPLIEGTGEVAGSQVICGEYPAPEGYAAGALVEASSASSLARVFVDLGAVVGGGYPSPFDANGGFPVDPGISSFAIVTTATGWTLIDPDGHELTATAAATAFGDVKVTATSGVTRIDVKTKATTSQTWTWKSASPADDGLYYFGALAVHIDEPSTFLAGADNKLTGNISRTDGRVLSLDDYRMDLRLAVVTPNGSQPIAPDSLDIDKKSGTFVFHYSATHASGVVTLEARVENLVTLPSDIPLTSVSARRNVTMTMPTQYPTVSPLPLKLSELKGSDGKAKAAWTVSAPADGTTGKVCFPDGLSPKVLSDAADRIHSWVWKIGVEGKCLEVTSGTRQLAVSVSNDVAANSEVAAVLPVEYVSAAGDKIEGSLPIEFSSTRPINAAAFGTWAILLLLLGILGPLALLLFFTWLTHKISRGSKIQRASFAVLVQADGAILDSDRQPLLNTEFGTENFKFQSAEPDTRWMREGAIGVLRSRVSLNPFGRPWFEMVPGAGHAIISSSGYLPVLRAKLAQRGRIAGFNGDLGAVWALVMPDAALDFPAKDGEPTAATLIVYLRSDTSEKSAMRQRMVEILLGRTLADRMDRARSLRADDVRQAPSKGSKNPPRETHHPIVVPEGDPPPPHSSDHSSQDPPPPRSQPRPESKDVSRAHSIPDSSRSGSRNVEDPPPSTSRKDGESKDTDDPPPSPWRSR